MYGFLKNLRFFDAFFILFLVEKGVSFTQIGILYAIRELITNILELPSGIIADSFGRKSSLAASLLIYILSFALFFLFDDFWVFIIAMPAIIMDIPAHGHREDLPFRHFSRESLSSSEVHTRWSFSTPSFPTCLTCS